MISMHTKLVLMFQLLWCFKMIFQRRVVNLKEMLYRLALAKLAQNFTNKQAI